MNPLLHKRCLLCSNEDLMPLKRYNKFYLAQCKSCGFVFSQKIPEYEELSALYNAYGRNDYLSPVTVKRFHQILDDLERFRKTNNLIDVGCGIGYFLMSAKERGWNVYGTEFTEAAVNICRSKGITMHHGDLEPQNYSAGFFDVAISIEVLEHINNPVEEIRKFKSILRNGGAVYITTPNFNSVSRKLLKEKWNVLAYPEHLCYYTSRTLRKLFESQNFFTNRIETTGVSITRMRSAIMQSALPSVCETSDDEKIRRALEENQMLRFLKSAVNRSLTWMKAGDNLKATFISR